MTSFGFYSRKRVLLKFALLPSLFFSSPLTILFAQEATSPTANPAAARPVGTIKAISGNTITLTTDAGTDVTIQVQDAAKLVRVAPGQKDLKEATPIQLADLQIGDRILTRGKLADDGKTVLASSVIAMKKSDIAEKQTHEREEWQRHGVGGLVNSIDGSANTITISTNSVGGAKKIVITVSKNTVLRRYAPDSVKFDDAKPAPIDQIKAGDQLRARGRRNEDGSQLAADEIVSGSFRNISGTISAVDANANSITVQDLATKKNIVVKITEESQLRKLPQQMAQRIAVRLKGNSDDTVSAGKAAEAKLSGSASNASSDTAKGPAGANGQGGMGRQNGAADLQQMILRMPAAKISDLQKGDAVLIVATQGTQQAGATAITLLGGVEAILQASPQGAASTILSPWSLSGGQAGDAGTP